MHYRSQSFASHCVRHWGNRSEWHMPSSTLGAYSERCCLERKWEKFMSLGRCGVVWTSRTHSQLVNSLPDFICLEVRCGLSLLPELTPGQAHRWSTARTVKWGNEFYLGRSILKEVFRLREQDRKEEKELGGEKWRKQQRTGGRKIWFVNTERFGSTADI